MKPTLGWKGTVEARKELRKNLTTAESLLWEQLRNYRFHGHRFRRQHGIGIYVVDFYHAKSMTVIELDGSIHDEPRVRVGDKIRQEYLEWLGYKVLRFKNRDVMLNLDAVLKAVFKAITLPSF